MGMGTDMLFHTLVTRQQDKKYKNKTDLLCSVTGMLAPFFLSSTTSVESSPSIIYANKLKHWLLCLYMTDTYMLLLSFFLEGLT